MARNRPHDARSAWWAPASAALLAGALLAGASLSAAPAGAVGFGRNKVQYDTFDWRVLETEHLDIHYYPAGQALAERAADYGEQACRELEAALGHRLTKRIPLVVYSSHYHFRQNNVSPSMVGESTGGFTEIFRTRVVLPYAGSEEDFRHVVHHELVHAYCFDYLYGGPVRSLFVLQNAFYIPLWFMEGIAEWYSHGWDSEGQMMIRDAAVGGGLPPFPMIHGGYFVYKAGWSAVDWLAERYGDDVVPRILKDLKDTHDLRVSVTNVTGEDLEALGPDWLEDVRRRTWPTLGNLESARRFGRPLTSRKRVGGAINGSPTLSPSGDRVVFLSDRSGTPDRWVVTIPEGVDDPIPRPRVLVRGARGGEFESLHPMRASVGWSPEGRYIVAAAQKGARDALYFVDVDSGRRIREIVPDLDAIERPDWSPSDARIVFTGMRDGQVDLWCVDADGSNLAQLTDDLHQERAPRWSPDGESVVFAAEGAESTGLDLWTIPGRGGVREPLRIAPGDQWGPAWSADGRRVYFVSDELGTRDLMALDRDTGETRRLSGLLGGADAVTLARQGSRLVLSAYSEGGWDLRVVDDADTLSTVDTTPIAITARPWEGWAEARHWPSPDSLAGAAAPDTAAAPLAATAPDSAASPPAPFVPHERDYEPRFRPEWTNGHLAYAGRGVYGGIQSSIGDVLGNHRVYVAASVSGAVDRTDAYVSYESLARRIDLEVAAFHFRDFLYDDRTTLGQPIGEEEDIYFSERKWGASVAARYPFHTFRRVEIAVRGMEVERVRYSDESRELGHRLEEIERSRSRLLVPQVSHTFDNTLWGWTGPVQGARSVTAFEHSIPFGDGGLSYGTAYSDVRHYYRFSKEYVFAWRALAAASFGRDPQEFRLGGPYSLRGYRSRVVRGRHMALASLEFRYPFLDYVRFGWPLRAAFGGVRGNLFLDVGTAFDDPKAWRLSRAVDPDATIAESRRGLEDLRIGFGVGARMRVAFLPVRIDVGWPSDGVRAGRPLWQFSLGPEF